MLDRWTIQWLRPPLRSVAEFMGKKGVKPDLVTCCGFILGICAIPALAMNWYMVALIFIVLNRVVDGIDGALARITTQKDAGGFLGIVLDFMFHSGVIFCYALADVENNALPAAALIFSFVGTGTSFLAYAIMAEKRSLVSITYPRKGFYYLGGLVEAHETITFFVAICLWSGNIPTLAWCFFGLCLLTTMTRVWGRYRTLVDDEGQ